MYDIGADAYCDGKEGAREERKRILELINELLPKYYEDGADEFAKQLDFAIQKESAEVKDVR